MWLTESKTAFIRNGNVLIAYTSLRQTLQVQRKLRAQSKKTKNVPSEVFVLIESIEFCKKR
jgi:hypothetical protein